MKRFVFLLLLVYSGANTIADTAMSLTIQQVKEKHQAEFMALPGVVSVGIGLSPEGEQAIIVGLDGKHPDTQKKLPVELEGYKVISRTVGVIKAQ